MAREEMEDWKFRMAKKRVKKVKGFYQHLGTWAACSAFFILINVVTDSEFWAIFPIAAWGLGVALHAIGVFGFPGRSHDWEERMIEQEMNRLEQEEYYRQQQKTSGALPPRSTNQDDGLELKEVRKEWRDSDLV